MHVCVHVCAVLYVCVCVEYAFECEHGWMGEGGWEREYE